MASLTHRGMISRAEDYRGKEIQLGKLGIRVADTLLICTCRWIPLVKGIFFFYMADVLCM